MQRKTVRLKIGVHSFLIVAATTLFTLLSVGASNCTKKGDGTPASTVSNPPVDVVDNDAGFYVDYVKDEKYTYKMHVAGDFNKPCKVSSTETDRTKKFIDCILEAKELDLWSNGANLQYNVPTKMCSYLSFTPYYYFGLKPGTGPSSFVYTIGTDGKIDPNSFFIDGVAGFSNSKGSIDTLSASTACTYDYSKDTSNPGPNCCSGSYLVNVITLAANATTGVVSGTSAVTKGDWGGKAANCLSGPAVDTQGKYPNGYPITDLMFVDGVGLNKIYTIEAPWTKIRQLIYVANWFQTSDFAAGMPAAIINGTRYHEFTCSDRADEANARIRVQIRKWSEAAQFEANGTWDTTGIETAPVESNQLNDIRSWKDWGTTYPGM